MTHITIDGRDIPLAFTLGAMEQLEQRFGAPFDLKAIVDRVNQPSVLLTLAGILAGEGQALTGEAAPVDRAWIARHAAAGAIFPMAKACIDEINASMAMETAEEDEDEEVDLVLEELKKKEPTGG